MTINVRLKRGNARGNAAHVMDHSHFRVPGIAQTFLDNRRTDAVFIDDENVREDKFMPTFCQALMFVQRKNNRCLNSAASLAK